MNPPSHCPCCKDPLINEYIGDIVGPNFLLKSCSNKLNHKFYCVVGSAETVSKIGIEISAKDNVYVQWSFRENKIYILKWIKGKLFKSDPKRVDLLVPFFEPDLSDYDKLINKIKTYITFS